MEKNSEDFPSAVMCEGGLAAFLNYLDFFLQSKEQLFRQHLIVVETFLPNIFLSSVESGLSSVNFWLIWTSD